MTKRHFSYLISFTILITIAIIAIQIYWNWKNFNEIKKSIIVDTQIAIDNSVDKYFIEVSKRNLEDFIAVATTPINDKEKPSKNILNELSNKKSTTSSQIKSFRIDKKNKVSINTTNKTDSIKKRKDGVFIEKIEFKSDSMSKPIIISNFENNINLFGNEIDFKNLTSKINKTLQEKNLSTNYILIYSKSKKIDYTYDNTNKKTIPNKTIFPKLENSIISKSGYIENDNELKFHFNDLNFIVFKRSLSSILLSILLSASTILCMFFLIRTIKKQKQIAEMKNDFISNISHELKTPIAIVFSAIEGIQNFNEANDKEKTKKYLQISNTELQKLNTIVEKILENAALENAETELKKTKTNISKLIEDCIQKHQLKTNKTILSKFDKDQIFFTVNEFHFENCINNLIENAIKYGGDTIVIILNITQKRLIVEIKDNGNGIPKHLKNKIFDKFYRIPTHNIHNVKGFGIGLYYVKQMIEKHNGLVTLNSQQGWTSFKINLPYE